LSTEVPVQPQPAPAAVSHTKRNLAILVVAVVALASVGTVYYSGFLNSSPLSNGGKPVWLFKDAYATYAAQTTIETMRINFTIRIQIVDFNSTAVEENDSTWLRNPLPLFSNHTTAWVKLSSASVNTVSGFTLSGTSQTTRTVGGKTYDCTAFQYTSGVVTYVFYQDNKVGFPVEITLSEPLGGVTFTYDLLLVHSNIPGLS